MITLLCFSDYIQYCINSIAHCCYVQRDPILTITLGHKATSRTIWCAIGLYQNPDSCQPK